METNEGKFISLLTPFDHAALLASIEVMTERYPFLSFQYLGKTILGKGIPCLQFGNGQRNVLYIGAHHGMEWITAMLLVRFINDFCSSYEKGDTVGKISPRVVFATHTITVIPMLNPDGTEYQIHGIDNNNPLYERLVKMNPSKDFSTWQANARGVDLNHNYDADFYEYKLLEKTSGIEEGCATRYSGEFPESEPEVAALCNLIRYLKNLRGIMTLHTQGEEIYYKSRGNCPKGADSVAQRISALTGYRLSEAKDLASYGGLTDWCIQKMNIPSFTLECGHGTNPLSADTFPSVYATLRKAFFAFPTLL